MPGPQPMPIEKKRALGNPGHQRLPDAETTIAVRPMDTNLPAELESAGAKVWNEIVNSPATAWIAETDRQFVVRYCRLYDHRKSLEDEITDGGMMVENKDGSLKVNPALAKLLDIERQLQAYEDRLGFSPAARSKLGMSEIKKTSEIRKLRKEMEEDFGDVL